MPMRQKEKRRNLKERLKNLPDSPGVYLFKDKGNKVIYIGKALSLKKRVSSYFQQGSFEPKISQLIRYLADFDYIPLSSEPEAFLLEARLIKEFQPRYNQRARDDKSYPFLKITKEKFPSFTIVRDPGRFRNHHPPPHPSPRGRGTEGRGAFYFGPYTDVIALRQAYRYIRNIFPVRRCGRKINPEKRTRLCLDFHLGRCKGPCAGKVGEKEYRSLADSLTLFLKGKYQETIRRLKKLMREKAEELNFEEAARYRNWMEAMKRMKQGEVHPCGGSILVANQAKQDLPLHRQNKYVVAEFTRLIYLNQLKKVLSLPRLPQRIEAVDISNLSGDKAVGSLVCFENGRPQKDGYRRFKIKRVSGIDDYKMMAEVIERRYQERKNLPDLLLVDGGKGHLSVVVQKLARMGLFFPVAALAKRKEEIFLPYSSAALILKKNSPALRLLEKIRDEAHRFAISYHRQLRRKALKESSLDGIKGIGEQRKKKLLSYFGSIAKIKEAKAEELKKLGLSEKLSRRVVEFLNQIV